MNASVKISEVTAAVDKSEHVDRQRVADNLAQHIETLSIEYDLRLATAIDAAHLARMHEGRAAQPWSADDAATVRTMADLLNRAAGQSVQPRPFSQLATRAVVTDRKLDESVSAGIVASNGEAP